MARLDLFLDPPRRVGKRSMARLVILTIFVLTIIFTASWMFYTPLMQIYWGTTGRMTSVIVRRKPGASGAVDPNEGVDLTKVTKPKDDTTEQKPATTIKKEEDPKPVTDPDANVTKEETKASTAGGTAVKRPEDDPNAPKDSGSSLNAKYKLTKERAEKAAVDNMGTRGPVVVTWANYHYKDFVMNWVEHLKETGCNTYLVGAMDDELLKHLIDADVPAFSMSSGLTLGDFGWGSATFNKMGREKISLIQTFTKWGVEVVISDVDTVWLQNPLQYMAKYPEADVLTSSDHLSASYPGDQDLEDPSTADSSANIGIMLFRPSAAALADEWVKVLDSDERLWDQNVFNDLMHRGEQRDHAFNSTLHRPDRLFIGYDGKLKFGILPVSMFCSGHTYFTQRMPETVWVEPYVVHATFQFSGTAGKRHRFRERLLWNDPPDYFQHENGFISANNSIPKELLTAVEQVQRDGSVESTIPHFHLVHHQFLALRAMFAFATVMNRAMVLPDLWCGFDRWWAPHRGVIPGSNFTTPYRCPADHVLELEVMEKVDWPEAEYGPHIEWREYSFLENERAQKPVVQRKLTVYTCGKNGAAPQPPDGVACADGSEPAEIQVGGSVWLKAQLNEEQIRVAFSSRTIDRYSLIHFEDAAALWKGFENEALAKKFKKRIDMYTSIWCCVNMHPGHIWHDIFWDTGAHKDKFGREIGPGEWKPQTGP